MIKICIDPGHGGKDRSNHGPTGYVEADGVLKISKYLRDMLLADGHFDVLLTRDTDKTLGLTERAMIAVKFKADLLLIEHTNAGGGKGTSVYRSVDIPKDEPLAEDMATAISKELGITSRGSLVHESQKHPKEDYYTVIDTAQDYGVKHVLLVESAFHDNPEEEKLLKVDNNLKKIAQAQFETICKFFGVEPEIRIRVNGKFINPSIKPYIKESHTMVSVRDIAESLGKKVTWDSKTKIVDIV